MRRAIASIAVVGSFALAPAAQAAIPSVPGNASGGGSIPCTTVAEGANLGERHCSGIFTTFEEGVGPLAVGAPIDVNIGFPPAPASGPDGDFPIVGVFHGWGGKKESLTDNGLQQWLDQGYAVFSMSDRGWGMSCGGQDPKRPTPECKNGYNHLLDTRYEVRDAQEVFEALADRDADGATAGTTGLIHPQKIAATGGSYGGGMAMALGALRDRKMIGGEEPLPVDGTLIPWVSDGGKAMEIAAVQPDIPWTDLAYSLQPNGSTLDYVADAPYLGPNGDKRIGVLKQTFVAGLFAVGAATSNYAPAGTDPDADLERWYAQINAGEPYDTPLAEDVIDELTKHHSSYYIPEHSDGPAPILISNGWTDDLFPADEAIRFYNRTRTNDPGTPISLIFTDHGHARGQNKGPDAAFRNRERHAWFDFYVKGEGAQPFDGVQTLTQTCGTPSGGASGSFDDANADLPFQAANWAELAPGEVRLENAAAQTIAPQTSAPQNGRAFDPIAGGGACARTDAADQTGAANYRLDPAPTGGYTLMGSPTIVADFFTPGATSQVAARLLDVAPDGTQSLVARGLWRPEVNPVDGAGTRQVFQLHPNGWKFAEGHIPKLELLPADQPYGRNSNGQAPVTVSGLDLRLPVVETPGGAVGEPAGKILPPGYELAADFEAPTDTDGDGLPDDGDNCPAVSNVDQADGDQDGTGDACDTALVDADGDGVGDDQDNCPEDANPGQADSDGDGEGDACDPDVDRDGDGHLNDVDNCPDVPNGEQEDGDGDGTGDACDDFDNRDIDGDGDLNDDDNCPSNPNPGQRDVDGDGVGDACDTDRDGDGIANDSDACPFDAGAGANGCPLNPISAPATGTGAGTAANAPPSTTDTSGGACGGAKLQSGTLADDVLAGTDDADAMFGLGGSDELTGRGGDDCIRGQRGRDSIDGGGGSDRLFGNGQRDRITGGSGSDRIFGRLGRDRIDAADGERDRVSCGVGRDRVLADPQDKLRGCEAVSLAKR